MLFFCDDDEEALFLGTSTGTSIRAKSAKVTDGGATLAPGASLTATCPTLRISMAWGTCCTVLDTTEMTAAWGLAQKGHSEGPVRRSSRLSVVRGPPSEGFAGRDEKGGHSETAHEAGGPDADEEELGPGGGGGESTPAAAEAKERKEKPEEEEEDKSNAATTEAAATAANSAPPPVLARCLRRRCRLILLLLLLQLLLDLREKEEDDGGQLLRPLVPAAGCSSHCRAIARAKK